MKRIASGSQVTTAPAAYGADSGTPGFFQDASTTPAGAPTQLTPKWANMVQEAVTLTILDSGAALADTLSQFADTVAGVHAVKSGATTTGTVTTPRTRTVIASDTCAATAATSACVGSSLSLASGIISAVVGTGASTASGAQSVVVGGLGSTASGASAAVIGGNGDATGDGSAVVGASGSSASGENAVVIGGTNGNATGLGAVVAGGVNADASGDYSVCLGGSGCTAGGDRSVVAGGEDTYVTGADSFAAGASTSYIPQGQHHGIAASKDATTANTTGSGRLILASRGVVLASSKTTGGNTSYVVGGGYSTNSVTGLETANADLKWTIDSQTGNFVAAGTFAGSGDPNADVAEYHPNLDDEVIPVGALVANVGRSVRLAVPGDRVFGVVSATPLLVAGGADLGWSGQHETDDWGRPIWADVAMVSFDGYDGRVADADRPIPEGATFYTLRDRVLSPNYDPARVYVSRSGRPAEWTPVAKLGLVRVRVAETVAVGDLLAPGVDGVAVATLAPSGRREVEVLEVLGAFDEARGYAIALCDVG
jgi:hypothetical protein